MARHQYICEKGKLTKWLLTMALLFSSFCWPGFPDAAPAVQLLATKTEIAAISSIDKKSISYKRACFLFSENYTNPYSGFPNFNPAIRHYNRLVKIKSDQHNQQFPLFSTAPQFCPFCLITYSPDEDLLSALRR